jgi:hypothetical protein
LRPDAACHAVFFRRPAKETGFPGHIHYFDRIVECKAAQERFFCAAPVRRSEYFCITGYTHVEVSQNANTPSPLFELARRYEPSGEDQRHAPVAGHSDPLLEVI